MMWREQGKIWMCFEAFPEFDSLPAARKNGVYIVDATAFFARPGPRIVDSLELLAGILHPEEFPEFISRGLKDNHVVRAEVTLELRR